MNAEVTVIIPAYHAWSTLPAVLDALGPQATSAGAEVIVVESSDVARARRLAEGRPWLRVLPAESRLLPGRARNRGVAEAQGDLLVFLDADAVPQPDWLDELLACAADFDAVAGAVLNGTPGSRIGTAMHLLEFSEWLPSRKEPALHAASCNLLVRRATFDAAGGFNEAVWPGEDTILTFPLGATGRLGFAPRAAVVHANRTTLTELVRHQRRLGNAFSHLCQEVPFPHRRFARPVLSPLGVPFRLAALARRVRTDRAARRRAVEVLPEILVGLAAWSWGVATAPAVPTTTA